MKNKYYNAIVMSEKLHRLVLEKMGYELLKHNIKNINSIQALILYNMGCDKFTVGELTKRGYYLGANVSYNLRKMVENGYIIQCPSSIDRRLSEICLSGKGLDLYEKIDLFFSSHVDDFEKNKITESDLDNCFDTWSKVENLLNKRG